MTESTRAGQVEHLADRLRALLDDCWDAGVQVLHHPEPHGACCQGDYLLQPREDDGGGRTLAWMPLAEKWALMPPGRADGGDRWRGESEHDYPPDTGKLCCCGTGQDCAACMTGRCLECLDNPERERDDEDEGDDD